jgi:signal peptidase I
VQEERPAKAAFPDAAETGDALAAPVPAGNADAISPGEAEIPAPDSGAAQLEAQAESCGRLRAGLREYCESILVTFLIALFGTTFIVQAFKIPSPSMEGTLLVGDHLLVNRFVYGGRGAWYEKILPYRDIRRGEIVVFKFPFDEHNYFVKRVVALPGDRMRIRDQQLYINGLAVPEPYKVHSSEIQDSFGDNFPPQNRFFSHSGVRLEWASELPNFVERGELLIPPGKYFVMGDNRDRSSDSRYWGFVDRVNVVGRPVLIYWSVEATEEDYADRSPSGRALGFINTFLHLPAKTRWNRMFRQVN